MVDKAVTTLGLHEAFFQQMKECLTQHGWNKCWDDKGNVLMHHF